MIRKIDKVSKSILNYEQFHSVEFEYFENSYFQIN